MSTPTDLVSLRDVNGAFVRALLDRADAMKRDPRAHARALAGRSVILLFEKPSLRTRVAFEVGVHRVGGHAMYFDHSSQRIGQRESVRDYAMNLERWVDAIVARTFSHGVIEELALHASVPVVNALSDLEHPCQALADLMTLRERLGPIEGRTLAYVGAGNNVSHALALGCAHMGVRFVCVSPEGYGPDARVIEQARHLGGEIVVGQDPGLIRGADAVYTDVWSSMGEEGSSASRARAFAPYRVDAAMMARAGNAALFMHCLPARRGEEVTDGVIDSPSSVVYDQAENRMHTQNALLAMLLGR